MTVKFESVLGVLKRQARRIPGWFADRVPIVKWLPRYNRHWILGDIVSGLTVGIMVVPQGLAYAKVGSLPMEFGLYTAFFGAIPYVLLGTCRDMNIGPSAVLALQTGMIIRQVAAESGTSVTTTEMAIVASTLSFLSGLLIMLIGLLKLGILFDFISNPVVVGFTSGVSLNILIAQLPSALGIKGVNTSVAAYRVFINMIGRLTHFNWADLAISGATILVILVLRELKNRLGNRWVFFDFLGTVRIPVVVIIITAVSVVVNRLMPDVPSPFGILRRVPHGFPDPVLPNLSLKLLAKLATSVPMIALISVPETITIAKGMSRLKKYKTDANQELFALGAINVIGSFFRAYPNMGTFSRSLINSQAGARSPFTSLFCGAVVLCALLFLPPAFYYIPDACLATIIIVSVSGLIVGPRTLQQLWRVQPWDMVSALLALILTVATNVATGILAAVGLSLIIMLHRIARPHFVVMERLKSSPSNFVDRDLPGYDTEPPPPGIIVIRLEEALIFPNAYYFREKIMSTVVELTRSAIPPLSRRDQPWCGNTDYDARARRRERRVRIKAEKRKEMQQRQQANVEQQRHRQRHAFSYETGDDSSVFTSGDILSMDDDENSMDYLPELPEQPVPRHQYNASYLPPYHLASRSMYPPTVLETVEERSCETESSTDNSTSTMEVGGDVAFTRQSNRQRDNTPHNCIATREDALTEREAISNNVLRHSQMHDDVIVSLPEQGYNAIHYQMRNTGHWTNTQSNRIRNDSSTSNDSINEAYKSEQSLSYNNRSNSRNYDFTEIDSSSKIGSDDDDDDDANTNYDSDLPFLRAMVFDFRSVNNIDASGLQMLFDLRKELYEYSGAGHSPEHWFEMHFVAVKPHVLNVLRLSGVTAPLSQAYHVKSPARDELSESTISSAVSLDVSQVTHPTLVHPSIADAVKRVNESLNTHISRPNVRLTEQVRIIPEEEWTANALGGIVNTSEAEATAAAIAAQPVNARDRTNNHSNDLQPSIMANTLPPSTEMPIAPLSSIDLFLLNNDADGTTSTSSSLEHEYWLEDDSNSSSSSNYNDNYSNNYNNAIVGSHENRREHEERDGHASESRRFTTAHSL